MSGIMEKLRNIQNELKAPKGQYNSYGGYYYRSCEDIMEALKPIVTKYNCTVYIIDELVNIGERYYIKATVTVTDTDTGESINNTGFAREELQKKGMDGAQITGTASSYARKYALNGMFLIDDTKDSDTTEYQNIQNNAPQDTAPQTIICPKCGKPVHGFTRPDGTKATAADVITRLGMCTECNKKRKDEPKPMAEPTYDPNDIIPYDG